MNKRFQTIIPPVKGWEPDCLYLVEVSYNSQNPVHLALFYSGYVGKNGVPGNYSGVMKMSPSCFETEVDKRLESMYYVKAIKLLVRTPTDFDHRMPPVPTALAEINELNRKIKELTTARDALQRMKEASRDSTRES